MSASVDRLTASVARLTTIDQSVLTLISGLAQQVRDAATDPAALATLADDIDAQSSALAAAVTANATTASTVSGAGSVGGANSVPAA